MTVEESTSLMIVRRSSSVGLGCSSQEGRPGGLGTRTKSLYMIGGYTNQL